MIKQFLQSLLGQNKQRTINGLADIQVNDHLTFTSSEQLPLLLRGKTVLISGINSYHIQGKDLCVFTIETDDGQYCYLNQDPDNNRYLEIAKPISHHLWSTLFPELNLSALVKGEENQITALPNADWQDWLCASYEAETASIPFAYFANTDCRSLTFIAHDGEPGAMRYFTGKQGPKYLEIESWDEDDAEMAAVTSVALELIQSYQAG